MEAAPLYHAPPTSENPVKGTFREFIFWGVGEYRDFSSLRGAAILPILAAPLALEPVLVLLPVGHGGVYEGQGLLL
jgi:hypothetical protein